MLQRVARFSAASTRRSKRSDLLPHSSPGPRDNWLGRRDGGRSVIILSRHLEMKSSTLSQSRSRDEQRPDLHAAGQLPRPSSRPRGLPERRPHAPANRRDGRPSCRAHLRPYRRRVYWQGRASHLTSKGQRRDVFRTLRLLPREGKDEQADAQRPRLLHPGREARERRREGDGSLVVDHFPERLHRPPSYSTDHVQFHVAGWCRTERKTTL